MLHHAVQTLERLPRHSMRSLEVWVRRCNAPQGITELPPAAEELLQCPKFLPVVDAEYCSTHKETLPSELVRLSSAAHSLIEIEGAVATELEPLASTMVGAPQVAADISALIETYGSSVPSSPLRSTGLESADARTALRPLATELRRVEELSDAECEELAEDMSALIAPLEEALGVQCPR